MLLVSRFALALALVLGFVAPASARIEGAHQAVDTPKSEDYFNCVTTEEHRFVFTATKKEVCVMSARCEAKGRSKLFDRILFCEPIARNNRCPEIAECAKDPKVNQDLMRTFDKQKDKILLSRPASCFPKDVDELPAVAAGRPAGAARPAAQ